MLLHSLLRHYNPQLSLTGVPNPEVAGVRQDSRQVQRGELFIARPGTSADGLQFVADARSRGAVAVVSQTPLPKGQTGVGLPQVVVPDAGAAASILANIFHGNPGETVRTLAVTGTNGKTTT